MYERFQKNPVRLDCWTTCTYTTEASLARVQETNCAHQMKGLKLGVCPKPLQSRDPVRARVCAPPPYPKRCFPCSWKPRNSGVLQSETKDTRFPVPTVGCDEGSPPPPPRVNTGPNVCYNLIVVCSARISLPLKQIDAAADLRPEPFAQPGGRTRGQAQGTSLGTRGQAQGTSLGIREQTQGALKRVSEAEPCRGRPQGHLKGPRGQNQGYAPGEPQMASGAEPREHFQGTTMDLRGRTKRVCRSQTHPDVGTTWLPWKTRAVRGKFIVKNSGSSSTFVGVRPPSTRPWIRAWAWRPRV